MASFRTLAVLCLSLFAPSVALAATSSGFDTTDPAKPLLFAVGGDEKMRLTSTGLGIKVTTPGYPLDVGGAIRSSGEIVSTLAAGIGQVRMIGGNYGAFWRNDGTYLYLMLTKAGDPYGIWSDLRPFWVENATGNIGMGSQLNVAGYVYAGGYFHNSDARLKTRIHPVQGLDIVEKLNGVSFTWKKDGQESVGVLAQDVEKVMPTAVREDSHGYKTVEYDQLIGPMIEAIKQLKAENERLSNEVAALKQKIAP